MATKNSTFRLTDADLRFLEKLESRMGARSKSDVLRFALVALRELLLDGFATTTRELRDRRRLITLTTPDGSQSLTLFEREDGSFHVGGRADPALFEGDRSDD